MIAKNTHLFTGELHVKWTISFNYNVFQNMLKFMADSVTWKMTESEYDWREVESILFCFYSIVESCEPEGDFIQKVCLRRENNLSMHILPLNRKNHIENKLEDKIDYLTFTFPFILSINDEGSTYIFLKLFFSYSVVLLPIKVLQLKSS